jgi:hypothetical protein
VEDPPADDLPLAEQLATYRRIRDELSRLIRLEMLFPARLAVLPQRK